MTCLNWTTETTPDTCPKCGGRTALLVGSSCLDCDEESPFAEVLSDGVETGIELTAHWCPACDRAVSVCVHVPEGTE